MAGKSDMKYSLVVRPVCKICYRGPTVWVGCTYQIPSVIGQGTVMNYVVLYERFFIRNSSQKKIENIKKTLILNLIRHLGWISEYFYEFLFIANCSNVV